VFVGLVSSLYPNARLPDTGRFFLLYFVLLYMTSLLIFINDAKVQHFFDLQHFFITFT